MGDSGFIGDWPDQWKASSLAILIPDISTTVNRFNFGYRDNEFNFW